MMELFDFFLVLATLKNNATEIKTDYPEPLWQPGREQPECLPHTALNKYVNINRCIIAEKSKRRDV